MIYSASRRTDMVAFHPEAVARRIAGSRALEAIVFWTKDPRNLVRHPGLARALERVPAVVQLTVTGLAGSVWERRTPPADEFLPELGELARRLPHGAVRWRFDPVLPNPDPLERFRRVRERLESALGSLDAVTISFPDPYRHAVKRAAAAGVPWPRVGAAGKRDTVLALAGEFAPGADRPVRLCCEPELLSLPRVRRAACVDGSLFRDLYGLPLEGLGKDPGQRAACGCVKSTDIGSYAMRCRHQCLYCYANREEAAGEGTASGADVSPATNGC